MKKFCSKCGTQLDLGKKTCAVCHAFNPYFIAGFTNNDAIENIPADTIKVPESSVEEENATEIASMHQEKLEHQKAEFELKYELLKVQEETKQYKKETFELVKEVQKELHDIELENRLLKEKVEALKNTPNNFTPLTLPDTLNSEHKPNSKKGVTVMAAVLLLIAGTTASYFYLSSNNKNAVNSNTGSQQTTAPMVAETKMKPEAHKAATLAPKDTVQRSRLLAAAVVSPSKPMAPAVATPVINKTKAPTTMATPASFALTESRLRNDLVGKKLSGCDITINNSGEINSIGNLVLVDRLSASYLKYKCVVKVKQGTETYTSLPYVYYSAEGTFIKVDGTNCE